MDTIAQIQELQRKIDQAEALNLELIDVNCRQSEQIKAFQARETAFKTAMKRMAETLGFNGEEDPGQIGPKILKQVPRLMALYTMQPDKFKEKFSFMAELAPILKDAVKDEF